MFSISTSFAFAVCRLRCYAMAMVIYARAVRLAAARPLAPA